MVQLILVNNWVKKLMLYPPFELSERAFIPFLEILHRLEHLRNYLLLIAFKLQPIFGIKKFGQKFMNSSSWEAGQIQCVKWKSYRRALHKVRTWALLWDFTLYNLSHVTKLEEVYHFHFNTLSPYTHPPPLHSFLATHDKFDRVSYIS